MSPRAQQLFDGNTAFAIAVCVRLYPHLRRHHHDWEDAQQAALLGLAEASERYDETAGTTFRTFAFYAIRNRVGALVKHNRRSRRAIADPTIKARSLSAQAQKPAPLSGGHITGPEAALDELLPGISPEQRLVLKWYYMDGDTIETIAGRIGKRPATTRYIIRLAREQAQRVRSLSAQAEGDARVAEGPYRRPENPPTATIQRSHDRTIVPSYHRTIVGTYN